MAIARETALSDIPTPEAIKPLFEGLDAGSFSLETRVVYAPLTRCRAIGNIPADISIEYYKNRAEKGQLVITEATVVDETGHGYPNTPGIYTAAQKEAWKPIVQAVHDKGGIFFCQIWHVGRISTEAYQPGGNLPVAPSAIAPPNTKSMNPSTFQMEEIPTPRALETAEIPKLIQSFREGARAAVKEVGFDGVEIHGASGYIIQQFLSTSSNQRTDEYGGSIENRCRFCLEVLDAVVDELGADKVGIRLSPYGNFNDTTDGNTKDLYNYLCGEIQKRGIAYLHMVESRVIGADDVNSDDAETLDSFREASKPLPFIAAGGYKRDSAAEAIASGHCDMVAMGRWAIANPDLLKRFKLDAPLNKYNRATFYTPGPEGLIDYPLLQDTEEGAKFFSD